MVRLKVVGWKAKTISKWGWGGCLILCVMHQCYIIEMSTERQLLVKRCNRDGEQATERCREEEMTEEETTSEATLDLINARVKNYTRLSHFVLTFCLFLSFGTFCVWVSMCASPWNPTADWLVIQYEWAWLFETGKERTLPLPLIRGRGPPSENQTTSC